MLVDPTDNLYVGYLIVKTGSSPLVNIWHLFSVNIPTTTATSFTSSLSITINKQDATTRANIYDMTFNNDKTLIIIAAAIVEDDNNKYDAGIYTFTPTENLKLKFGI